MYVCVCADRYLLWQPFFYVTCLLANWRFESSSSSSFPMVKPIFNHIHGYKLKNQQFWLMIPFCLMVQRYLSTRFEGGSLHGQSTSVAWVLSAGALALCQPLFGVSCRDRWRQNDGNDMTWRWVSWWFMEHDQPSVQNLGFFLFGLELVFVFNLAIGGQFFTDLGDHRLDCRF